MSDILKTLEDYPDLDFIGGYTLEKLEREMIGWYKEKYKEITQKEPMLGNASTARLILQTCSYYIFHGYKIGENNARMNCLKYATGDYLANLGAMKRVGRKDATAATTTLRFSMSASRTNATGIPAGSRVTAGDGVYFATQEYAEIPIGALYIDVRAICSVAGVSGNLYGVGELARMVDIIPFIDIVTNLTAPENGADEEDEEDYRQSIYIAPEGYTAAGSMGAYEYWVSKYSSAIIDARVRSPSPRILEITCLLEGGELPGEEFRAALAERMLQPDIKMLTDVVNVINPVIVSYDVGVTYYINQSDRSAAETIQEKVDTAIDEYILWQKFKIGRDINPSVLMQLIVSAGAKRATITSPTFKAIGDSAVAIAEGKTVVYGGLEND
ncbi:MAG: baseplate J/gp47 family protein [Lachnospiraceae bacterium]|nr:baseplate J/gp47 family protein [Lachnospiraceae bacterium]